ncbi:MAG: hypothetical protein J0I47_00240 [Sphingomonas sp.]|nr:hypothetical protein [Sphingomonas sp.]
MPPIIERITALLDQDTDQSVTYAALEARLALEKVCYDRLRQRHDYISHDQLKKWQPGQIVNTLMTDVDENVTETMTLMVGRNPDVKPEDDDFVEVGTEIGFDPKRISKMWQALAKLALHVRVPKNRDDAIADYGDKTAIRAKVEEVVEELRRLAKGTMTFSGIGMEVSFDCPACGEKNKRRAKLLRHGQQIHCINPNCKLTWKTEKQGEDFYFEPQTIDVNCESCRAECHLPWRYFMEMKHDEVGSFSCSCGHKNYVKWELAQVRPNSENEPAST